MQGGSPIRRAPQHATLPITSNIGVLIVRLQQAKQTTRGSILLWLHVSNSGSRRYIHHPALLLGSTFTSIYNAAIHDCYFLRYSAGPRPKPFHFLNNIITVYDLAENDMLAIQMCCSLCANKEQRPIRVFARIGHGQAALLMRLGEILVVKLWTVDGFTARAVGLREVAPLAHEAGNYAVEARLHEGQANATLGYAPLAGTEAPEVLNRSGDNVGEELKLDVSNGSAVNADLEKYKWILPHLRLCLNLHLHWHSWR